MAKSRLPGLLCSTFLFISLLSGLSLALFSPPDNHLIACASESAVTLDDHRVFLPEPSSHSRQMFVFNTSVLSPLHGAARVSFCPFSYEFRIKQRGFHLIRLHFYPFQSMLDSLSSGLFHVAAGELSLLCNFSTSVPVVKEYLISIDSEKLVISFTPADRSFAFVNAIEVISAPGDLIGDIASLVRPDQIEKFSGLSYQAFETLYRINVGGPKVTPYNDSLWRTWLPDDVGSVKLDSSGSKIVSFSGRINYLQYGASREVAPDSVYKTGRVMHDSNGNMTWAFSVNAGNRYLIRMHFCDVASLALNELYFNIYINGYLGYKDFDISDVTGQLASPYYIDFVVDSDSSGLLNVSIAPSSMSKPSWVHGLLNGLEVFKMNKTANGLAGEIPTCLLDRNAVKKDILEFFRSLLCGIAIACLLGVLFVLVVRWRAEYTNNVAWSPLPTGVLDGKLAKGYEMVSGKLDV